MAYWLLKTEPETFSYDDLERLGKDRWNGVRNFVALKNLQQMKRGDLAFIYHSGKEKAIVGVAEIISEPYPDPDQNDSRLTVVDVAPRYRLIRPISLKRIKTDIKFKDWELISQPRLSVVPVKEEYWKLIQESSMPELVRVLQRFNANGWK
ncbi:MAG TPA: EVE domain-containing protein [Bacillota bacterium]|jgi:predicted RNA-binding protein with PUA-like domain|nr:EVE domain-containing protein [Bacillota bacterium]HOL10183.1 EVE domain-containing protein [Bacillota bacterium]HPO97935.1 EVE domain-containing protein [Bacillota bacterium]